MLNYPAGYLESGKENQIRPNPCNPCRDKIFVSTGSEVKGFTKKGKMFLQFETNLAESIQVSSVGRYVGGGKKKKSRGRGAVG